MIRRCRCVSWWMTSAMFLVNVTPARAQEDGFCFPARSGDSCRWALSTDIRPMVRVLPSATVVLGGEVGLLRNLGRTNAVGLSLGWLADGTLAISTTARYRRWVTDRSSIELSAGSNLTGEGRSGVTLQTPTLLLGVKATYDELVGAVARLELGNELLAACYQDPQGLVAVCGRDERGRALLYMGVEGSGWPGLTGLAASALIAGVAFGLLIIACGGGGCS